MCPSADDCKDVSIEESRAYWRQRAETAERERDEARLQTKNLSEDLARLHEAADKLRKDRDEAISRADGLRMILNMEREKNEPT